MSRIMLGDILWQKISGQNLFEAATEIAYLYAALLYKVN